MKIKTFNFVLLLLSLSVGQAIADNNIEECETVFKKNKYSKIIEKCLNLIEDSNRAKAYKTVANLFKHVSYERINSIFYFFNKEKPPFVKINYLNRQYSKTEKLHLKNAYKKLKENTQSNSVYFNLIYAKIAYINIIYFQIRDSGIISSETIESKKEFKSKVYIPRLKKHIKENPNDKEALYLIGKEGLKLESIYNGNSTQQYYSVQNKEYVKYLEKSASLGLAIAQEVVGLIAQWEALEKQLRSVADSGYKDVLYKLGMKQLHHYIDYDNTNKDLLKSAIADLEKAYAYDNHDALSTLVSVYGLYKPNEKKYFYLLKELVKKTNFRLIELGNYYWCKGNKIKAKEMFINSKNIGGVDASEAILSLEDLITLQEPIGGCKFKL